MFQDVFLIDVNELSSLNNYNLLMRYLEILWRIKFYLIRGNTAAIIVAY